MTRLAKLDLIEALEDNIKECKKRGMLWEYVEDCERQLKELKQ